MGTGKGILILGVIAAVVAAPVIISHFRKETPPPVPLPRGDVNGDGVVDMGDVIHIKRILMGLLRPDGTPYPADWLERADVNGSGTITIADVTAAERIIMGP
jgi:hypothetical protein